MPSRVVIVSGPTACGKTDLVHRLADPDRDIIINCDSRQFFRWLNIGTAKPHPKLLSRYHYRLVDFLDPGNPFSVYDFLNHCIREIESIDQMVPSNNTPRKIFLVGGSMFYVEVLKKGLPNFPPVSQKIKSDLQSLWKEKGIDYLGGLLKEKDPELYHEVDLHNPRRVIRALEILESGGQVSQLRKKRQPPPWIFLEITPILPRKIIYQRIEKRVVQMMQEGWIDEVKGLLKRFSPEAIKRCSAIGYQEIIDLINGKNNYQNTITQIQQKTRQLAKQQITWIKKNVSGYLIFNSQSSYNIASMFDLLTQEFTNPNDAWLNRYPRSHSQSSLPPHPPFPTLLVSEDPVADLEKKLNLF